MRYKTFIPIGIVFLLLILLAACEMLFTTSLVSYLKRDMDSLSNEQKVTVYEDKFSSGELTPEDVQAVADIANANPTDPVVNQLAGQIYIEESGINDALESALGSLLSGSAGDEVSVDEEQSNLITNITNLFTQPEDDDGEDDSAPPQSVNEAITAVFTEVNVDPVMLVEGAGFLVAAADNGAELTETEYLMGGMGLAVEAAGNMEDLEDEEVTELQAAITAAGGLTALAEQIETGGEDAPELSEAAADLVLEIQQAQEFLSQGTGSLGNLIPGGSIPSISVGPTPIPTPTPAPGQPAPPTAVPTPTPPPIPEGMDITVLFEQWIAGGGGF